MKRQNIQPASLSKRVVGGHVLYSHVVVVEGKKTIFVSGQLARGSSGEIVGAGDMRAQMRQVGENIKGGLQQGLKKLLGGGTKPAPAPADTADSSGG